MHFIQAIRKSEYKGEKVMKKYFLVAFLLIASGNVRAEGAAVSEKANEPKRVDLRFGVGLTYMSGFQDVSDYFLNAYGVDAAVIPIGFSFNTTVQISHGNKFASIPTFGVGPVGIVYTQETIYGSGFSNSSSSLYVDIPINGSYGIKFLPHNSVGPYVRGGVAYHLTVGDMASSASPGAFVAGGADFLQTRRVNINVEAAYDNSKVNFKGISSLLGSASAGEIKTGGLLFSVRAVF
jgi:hypothetical protein